MFCLSTKVSYFPGVDHKPSFVQNFTVDSHLIHFSLALHAHTLSWVKLRPLPLPQGSISSLSRQMINWTSSVATCAYLHLVKLAHSSWRYRDRPLRECLEWILQSTALPMTQKRKPFIEDLAIRRPWLWSIKLVWKLVICHPFLLTSYNGPMLLKSPKRQSV